MTYPPMLLTPAGEHALPPKMLASVIRNDGWNVSEIDASMPPPDAAGLLASAARARARHAALRRGIESFASRFEGQGPAALRPRDEAEAKAFAIAADLLRRILEGDVER